MNIKYFLIMDMLEREKRELEYCLAERMILGYYNKPLQGSLFRKVRDILMDYTPFPDEERVNLLKM